MSVPYGAVTYAQNTLGSTLRYALPHVAGSALGVAVLAGFSHRDLQFRDVSRWVYDWFGQRVFERPAGAGELSAFASDLTQWEQRALARATLTYDLAPGHLLRLVVAPDLSIRTGRERLRVNRERLDPLTTRREILQVVSGLEYALRALDDRIENSAFAKHYLYEPSTDQVETFDDSLRRRDESRQRLGAGDALRVRFSRHALGKLSYEYATRLPRPDEVFGDGALILPQLDLKPEVSHNANLSVRIKPDLAHGIGRVGADVAGFWRQTRDMVVQLPAGDRVHTLFKNVADVTTLGVDGALDWSSAQRWFGVRANGTWLDSRNRSQEGLFAMFRGQRLPNRPWLLANATVHARILRFVADNGALTLAWSTRYVHEFLPGWDETEAQNDIGKLLIPTAWVGVSARRGCCDPGYRARRSRQRHGR